MWMLNQQVEVWEETYLLSPKVSPPRNWLLPKGRIVTCSGRITLTRWSRLMTEVVRHWHYVLCIPDLIHKERPIDSVLFSQKHIWPQSNRDKTFENPNWGTIYRIANQWSSKVPWLWDTRESYVLVTAWRGLRRCDNSMQCMILNLSWSRKRTSCEIQIRSVVQLMIWAHVHFLPRIPAAWYVRCEH